MGVVYGVVLGCKGVCAAGTPPAVGAAGMPPGGAAAAAAAGVGVD